MCLSVNFRCEDVSVALQIFSQGFFLFKFDLKSGYHHVEIFPDHRKYLAFSWDFGDGVVKYFHFTVLLFGLSSALYLLSLRCSAETAKINPNGFSIHVVLRSGAEISYS